MNSWTLRLIVANVIVFVLTTTTPAVMEILEFVPLYVLSKPWTAITYMFVHANFGHIFFNMLALFFFGPRLELELGSRNFLLLYFISGIMAAVVSLFFTPLVAIVGASGAVYGVMLGFAYLWPRERIYVWAVFPVEARWMVVGMTILSLFGGFGIGEGGIAHFAHLGGFLGGFISMRFFARRRFDATPVQEVVDIRPSASDMERWSSIRSEALHPVNREELERILAKINGAGIVQLTQREREFLDRFSNR